MSPQFKIRWLFAIYLIAIGTLAQKAFAEPAKPLVTFNVKGDPGVRAGNRIVLTPNGKFVLQAGMSDYQGGHAFIVTMYSAANGQKVRDLLVAKGVSGRMLEFSADCKMVATQVDDNTSKLHSKIHVFDLADGKERWAFDGTSGTFSFSGDNKFLAAGTDSSGLHVWNLQDGTQALEIAETPGLRGFALDSRGKTLAWMSGNPRLIHIVDVATKTESTSFGQPADMWKLRYTPDDRTLLVQGEHATLLVNAATYTPTKSYRIPSIGGFYPAISGDSSVTVYDSETKSGKELTNWAIFLDVAKAEPRGYLQMPGLTRSYYSLSADGKTLMAVDITSEKAAKVSLFEATKLEGDRLAELVPPGGDAESPIALLEGGAAKSTVPKKPPEKTAKTPPNKASVKGNAPVGEGGIESLVGTWKVQAEAWEELWTIAGSGEDWKVTIACTKDGKDIGSGHGTHLKAGKDGLTFQRAYEKKPAADVTTSNCAISLNGGKPEVRIGHGIKATTKPLIAVEK